MGTPWRDFLNFTEILLKIRPKKLDKTDIRDNLRLFFKQAIWTNKINEPICKGINSMVLSCVDSQIFRRLLQPFLAATAGQMAECKFLALLF